jgi:hypothetical protein
MLRRASYEGSLKPDDTQAWTARACQRELKALPPAARVPWGGSPKCQLACQRRLKLSRCSPGPQLGTHGTWHNGHSTADDTSSTARTWGDVRLTKIRRRLNETA